MVERLILDLSVGDLRVATGPCASAGLTIPLDAGTMLPTSSRPDDGRSHLGRMPRDTQVHLLHQTGRATMAVMLAVLPALSLSTGTDDGSICGIHTIRAADTALSLISDAGCSFVVQHFDWSQIEPLSGEYFWEYPDSVVRDCKHYGLDRIVRFDQPPDRALSSGQDTPPVDVEAYTGFVARAARRYEGQAQAASMCPIGAFGLHSIYAQS